MLTFFVLAFLVGMSHALEADHIAAVGAMASGQKSVKSIVRTGAAWGLGHTLTLLTVGAVAMTLHLSIADGLGRWLEFCVGVMLTGLGGHIVYRLVRDRVHFHMHRHVDDSLHFHAHAHAGEAVRAHDPAHHDHDHAGLPLRSLLVGMMHGMAGSAALLVLTASVAPDAATGLGYMLLFGLGSILGMAALSAVIAVPLAYTAQALTWANRAMRGAAGAASFGLGLYIMAQTMPTTMLP